MNWIDHKTIEFDPSGKYDSHPTTSADIDWGFDVLLFVFQENIFHAENDI